VSNYQNGGTHIPREDEREDAHWWCLRLTELIEKMRRDGFEEKEAVAFLAEACVESALVNGLPAWSISHGQNARMRRVGAQLASPPKAALKIGARRSIKRVLNGDATLAWVIDIFEVAIPPIEAEYK
jgi:hypothetical protein